MKRDFSDWLSKKVNTATVKVMRSYDDCHFEVWLGISEETTIREVNILRKDAQRLADEAVRQYKVAKATAEADQVMPHYKDQVMEIEMETTEAERTPRQKALLKAWDDYCYHQEHPYDYEDDWDLERDQDNEHPETE